MEITNKRYQFTVTNTVNDLTVRGEVTMNEDKTINSFNGNVRDNEQHVGDFYYSENLDGKINKSINNVSSANISAMEALIAETVNQIKNDNE